MTGCPPPLSALAAAGELRGLTPSGAFTDNVLCGLVDWLGNRLAGCGAAGRHRQFHYHIEGLRSTVSLCGPCEHQRCSEAVSGA